MDVQHFERLLARYERLAGLAPRLKWLEKECDHLRRTLATAQEGNRRRDRDMEKAEAKIAEWSEYASTLRGAINAIDPHAIKRKKIVLPEWPKPLETEFPF